MSTPSILPIDAVVDEAERPALKAAAEQLVECLGAASGSAWRVLLRLHPSLAAIAPPERPAIVIVSLLPELARGDESAPAIEARWRGQLAPLAACRGAEIFLCTIFRHLPGREPAGAVERIRRLNLLAAELSHDLGLGVIDIDRVFAHIGARRLATDYRLGGRMAAEAAGHAIVESLLSAGLDDLVAPELQERAKRFQGGLGQIDALLRRRLGPAPGGTAHGGTAHG